MGPADVREQQRKVADAQAPVFVSPACFVSFPVILKGWIERVFTLGFAITLTQPVGELTSRGGSARCWQSSDLPQRSLCAEE